MWKNSNFVDRNRNEYLKGVVNINSFREYINTLFLPDGSPDLSLVKGDCQPERLDETLVRDILTLQDCGAAQAARLGITVSSERNEFYLGDFFDKVKVGMRISYVEPMLQNEDGTNTDDQEFITYQNNNRFSVTRSPSQNPASCFRPPNSDPTYPYFNGLLDVNSNNLFFNDITQYGGNSKDSMINAAVYKKSFYVPNGNNIARVIPIVCSEIEIDPTTPMSNVVRTYNKNINGQTLPFGFFENYFGDKQQDLKNQLIETQEFKTLFN